MNTREFSELLKGCRPVKDLTGNVVVQSIMNMQIVCLTTDPEFSLDERFANPLTSLVASNSNYGQITFTNKDDKEVIVPTQIAVITKQAAQNHGMIKAGYVGSKKVVMFDDAACVQGSQCGVFQGSQEYRMIPISIREMAYDTIGRGHDHSRMYPAVRKLGVITDSQTTEYIDKYYSKYDTKLEQFIAHFERPKRLIGIVVLIDGEIIAIDKFPSFSYAEQVWDLMIRDCYGSLAIISELKNRTSKTIFTDAFNSLKTSNKTLVDRLDEALKKTKETITTSVTDRIQEILDMTFDAKIDEIGNPSANSSGIKSYTLKNEGYIGQVLCETEYNHLVSIVRKEAFDANALRVVNLMREKARRQDRFTI